MYKLVCFNLTLINKSAFIQVFIQETANTKLTINTYFSLWRLHSTAVDASTKLPGVVTESIEHWSRVWEIVGSSPWSSQTTDL